MRKYTIRLVAFLGLSMSLLAGCSDSTAPTVAVQKEDDHDHDHDRDKMLIAHLGKHHACLTAHLSSKDGNELDVFVETIDKAAQPVALPLPRLVGKAKYASDGKEQEVIFEPAPANERPKDEVAGTCSHYVAKAPWMKADDIFTLTIEAELDGRIRKATWKSFNPKKYAHHED